MDNAGFSVPMLGFAKNIVQTNDVGTVIPTSAAMDRFNAIMGVSDPVHSASGVSHVEAAIPAPQYGITAPINGSETLGNQILSGLEAVSGQYATTWHEAKSRLASVGHEASVVDMLRLQSSMMQLSVQYDLVGKLVSSVTGGIDKMVRIS